MALSRRWFGAWLAAAVAVAGVSAEARMHSPYRGHRIIPANAAPLDGFTQPSGAYSFRKLRSAYAGPAVRLRRVSDNAELDINFLGCTGFTGCPIDTAAATTHCASTTCFIRTWYDQSGLAQDMVNATPATQPALLFNCYGSLPCAVATDVTQALGTVANVTPVSPVGLSAVGERAAGTGSCQFRQNAGNNRIGGAAASANTWNLSGVILAAAADASRHAFQGVINAASSVLNVDGVETTGNVAVSAAVFPTQIIGAATTTCRFAEFITWNAYGLTAGERTALQTNQKSFWGTP